MAQLLIQGEEEDKIKEKIPEEVERVRNKLYIVFSGKDETLVFGELFRATLFSLRKEEVLDIFNRYLEDYMITPLYEGNDVIIFGKDNTEDYIDIARRVFLLLFFRENVSKKEFPKFAQATMYLSFYELLFWTSKVVVAIQKREEHIKAVIRAFKELNINVIF